MRDGMNALKCICFFLALGTLALPQTLTPESRSERKGKMMTNHARGTFEVKLAPLPSEGVGKEANLVKMSINKQFAGDLIATSKGEMLADGMAESGSGGYVAMERVSGTLGGRRGSFVLQHSGTMLRGVAQLSVTVVPESGKEQLAGLAGKMTIRVEGGKHFYDFEYTLAEVVGSEKRD